jgi:GNAT superfamily N-acetyltransferase
MASKLQPADADSGVIVPTVRDLRTEDRVAWLALWESYNAFYGLVGDLALDPQVTANTWERILDLQQELYALVAELGTTVVGLAHFTFHLSTSSQRQYCYLEDLFVHKRNRLQGTGRALVESVCEYASRRDAARVYWQTQANNHRARRLYDTIAEDPGFVVYRLKLQPS